MLRGAAEAGAPRGYHTLWHFMDLQGRLDGYGRLCVFEVNARTTGITGMRASLGFNEVDMLYDSFILGRHGAVITVEPGPVLDAAQWTDPVHQYARG